MSNEILSNLRTMKRLMDSAQKARKNASMSFDSYLVMIDVKEPFKPVKRPYPRLKVHSIRELYKESAKPKMSVKCIGAFVACVVCFIVSIPFLGLYLLTASKAIFVLFVVFLALSLATMIAWLIGMARLNAAIRSIKASDRKKLVEAQKKLAFMNDTEKAKRADEAAKIDEKYNVDLAKYKTQFENYQKAKEEAVKSYNSFISENRNVASSLLREYEKIGQEYFPDCYQDFGDLAEIINVASFYPSYDIHEVMGCYRRRETERMRRDEEEARARRAEEEEWRRRKEDDRRQREHDQKMEDLAKRQQETLERQTGQMQCMNCRLRMTCMGKTNNKGDCRRFC